MRASLLAAAWLTVATPSFANDAALEVCRAKLKQAQQLQVLTGMEWNSPQEPQVTAGKTYYTMPFHAKTGFAETLNCFFNAGKSGCINFDITHWQTGKVTDRFSACKLTPK